MSESTISPSESAELDREDREREGAPPEFEVPDVPSPEVDVEIDIPDDPEQDA